VFNDTWEWDGTGRDDRPAVLWAVPWLAAGVREAELDSLEMSVRAGALGSTQGEITQPVDGAELHAWDVWTGRWMKLGGNATAAPSVLEGASADPTRHLFGPGLAFHLALTPRAAAGDSGSPGEVQVDYLEFRVRYRAR
jgi:hypothetical protein